MTAGAPSPPGARLAAVLQKLRQRTGLSLAQLANETTYSKSSWERYLNGKSLPPRSAVKELCRLADEPADHSLALLDIARTHRTTEDTGPTRGTPVRQNTAATETDTPTPGFATVPPDTAADTGEPARSGADDMRTSSTGHWRVNIVTALVSTCAVVLGALVLTHLPPTHQEEAPASPTPSGALCRHTACQNKDPIATRCAAEPLTLAEHETATGAFIQIRYSQECGTSWARMWGAVVKDRVEMRVGGRHGSLHSAQVTTRKEADTYVHTLMSVIGPGTPVQACFSPAAGGAKECFGGIRKTLSEPRAVTSS
ncbi:helix-turn-helix domain-containing protein [Streptomyces sp. NPDC102405]|uniref:helix-turn-helix domain-containing protein n=1 Tax=Streptomyces sp. NPDC102405 TaxID=3366170 RepID=UPI0038020B31